MTDPDIEPPAGVGASRYDAMPYRGEPFAETHPASLAAIARLLRLSAAAPETCRVLELGCCDGGNLIPMAEQLPNARFIGIDYSAVQIEMGRARISQLGLTNIELRPDSILDITLDLGLFDYIICHGVFSWVPDNVRDRILDVCQHHLTPDGIAYVSYNTQPGWHLRGIVRDMMRYHALRFETAQRQTQEARLILEFVSNFTGGRHTEAYALFLKTEAELLKKLPDHYLFHEHLEEHCNPYYFKDFVAMARDHGLDYLAESRLAAMAPVNFGPEAEQALAAIATNLVELEQFMDFLRNRTFRQTLIHRVGRTPDYTLQPESLHGLHISSALRSKSETTTTTAAPDFRPHIEQSFQMPDGFPVTSSHPLLKAALHLLGRAFPISIEFEDLVDRSIAVLEVHAQRDGETRVDRAVHAQTLGRGLLKLYTSSDVLDVRALPSSFTLTLGERPIASPLARLQANEHERITNRRHESIAMDDHARAMLRGLDGTRTAADLARWLGPPATEATVTSTIARLARLALLDG